MSVFQASIAGVDVSPALAQPVRRVRPSWVVLWSLANFAVTGVVFGARSIVEPQLVQRIDPEHKVSTMAIAGVLAGLVPLVASPLFGALSDRTRSSRGRRHPWLLVGTLGTAFAFAVLSFQTSVGGFLLVSVVAGATIAVLGTSLVAVIPDEVPVTQRATVSAWGGVAGGSLGLLVCTALVAVVITGPSAGYLAGAVVLAAGVLPFALLTRGSRLRRQDAKVARSNGVFTQLLVSPRRYPDFWLAMAGRFLFFLANGLFSSYLFFFLEDSVGYADPAVGVLILNAVFVLCAVVASVPIARRSDQLVRRKRFTIVSAAFQVAACALLAASPTWPAAIAGAVLLGIGFGVYSAVDQALVTEVLPRPAQRGKDMGLINTTFLLAMVLTPAIAGPVILYLGGYAGLFALAAVIGAVAAILVQPIRGVH